MKKISITILILFFFFSFSLLSLMGEESPAKINETAKFLAGQSVKSSSSLYKFTHKRFYKSYKYRVVKGWNKFQKPNILKIKKWWVKHQPLSYNKNVFYPFSGPDIMNALTFFPDAENITMFGLEAPGKVTSLNKLSHRALVAKLNAMKKSLNTIFRVNFFRTKAMNKNLNNKSLVGISDIMMFFLAINKYDVVSAKRIAIDASGNISQYKKGDSKIDWINPPKSRRIPGIEILFKKGNGKIQRIRYFNLNVINYALKKQSPNFLKYLKKEGPYTTILKSASYLMHTDKKFSKIRSFVLKNSDYILQDDSGVPIRFFNSSKWKVQYHGYYDRPIKLFANRYQKRLRKNMQKKSTGVLPFSYGYDYQKGQSNLISAEKKK